MTKKSSSEVDWPPGFKRTLEEDRERGKFHKAGRYVSTGEWDPTEKRYKTRYQPKSGITFSAALSAVQQELARMEATDLVIEHAGEYNSRSGEPLSGKREPADPGIVVRWKRGPKSYVIACDKYADRAQNLRAIAKTIEATRGIERWGAVTGEMAFRGYEALPAPAKAEPPWVVLGVAQDAPEDVVQAAYRALALKAHPDRAGGSDAAMSRLNEARDAMLGRGSVAA